MLTFNMYTYNIDLEILLKVFQKFCNNTIRLSKKQLDQHINLKWRKTKSKMKMNFLGCSSFTFKKNQ